MPVTLEKIEKLEKLLVRVEIPVQKKQGFARNINRVVWLKENFDVRNKNHPKRNEIMALIDDLLSSS
jgi:hypothetical protein